MDFDRYKNKMPYPEYAANLTEAQKAAARQVRDAHRAEDQRLKQVFKADLEKEFGVVGHPKADKLFGMAWEHGHSSGYEEIFSHYSELVELVK